MNRSGTLKVTNSTFSGNGAIVGGGIYGNHTGGTLGAGTVTNSTFSGNAGSAIVNAATLTVTNSTFVTNAIENTDLCGDTGNAPCPVTLRNTIVANSSGGSCYGNIIDGGHNLDDGTSCGFSEANGSLSNTDPQLDPAGLQDNGGPTETVALCTGADEPAGCTAASPAIDAGDPVVCAMATGDAPVNSLDQRGFARPGSGHTDCSIGPYEAMPRRPHA